MDDLIAEFITETMESLAVLDTELVKLEQNPNDPAILGNIFRLMHTIKGTCGFLGLPRLESVAHASENVLGKIREGALTVTPRAVTLILESIDRIKMLVDFLAAEGKEKEGDDKELIALLDAFAEGHDEPAAAPEAESVETPAEANESSEPAAEAEAPALDDAPPAEPEAAKEEPKTPVAASPAADQGRQQAVAHGLEAEPKEGGGGVAAIQTIRVNIDVLESLMQMVGELVLTRNQLLQIARTRNDSEFGTPLQRLSAISTQLQEDVMKTRMQPIGNAWSKFPRLVRDLSMELGKKIELRMIGAETELDRQVLEMIKDPLTHMVRNSADHGLERPADRVAAGKGELGTITLSAYHEGGHIIIEIGDDGRGLNISRIREKAIANGLATESEMAGLSEQQIVQFIFKPGFSTAEKVTSVSGRGVGMDVVKTNIEKIGGSIDVKSREGRGSTFYIKIPLTLAIVSVLIVEADGERLAIPQMVVNELVRVSSRTEHHIEFINNTPVLRLRERLLPLVSLPEVLGLRDQGAMDNVFIVVCRLGAQDFGVIVDRVFDIEEIVVKPVAPILKHLDMYSGCTILGDGSVIMILDPNGLAKRLGDLQATDDKQADAESRKARMMEKTVSFLVFRTMEETLKAVPLELVSRLEELKVEEIEHSNGRPVVQYRGDLMRLITLDEAYEFPKEGLINVIVFNFDNHMIGLVVHEICDIIQDRLDVKINSGDSRYLGSMVLNGKTTDVLDAGYILTEAFGNITDEVAVNDAQGAQNTRVLLVDDSAFFRNLTAPFIAAAGFQVVTADSATEAVKMLEVASDFDIIVSDIEMPGMDGYEFATHCKQNPRLSHIPMIAYTSRITKESVEKGLGIGFADYVAKMDRDGLMQAMRKHLNATVVNAA